MAIKNKHAQELSKLRKRKLGGFADPDFARKAQRKSAAARKKKRDEKEVEDLKF